SAAASTPKLVAAAEPAEGAEQGLAKKSRLNLLRGGLTAAAGGFVAFSLMATDAQFRWGVPAGIVAVAASVFGILDLLGTFDDPGARAAKKAPLAELPGPLGLAALSLVAPLAFIGIASRGSLPIPVAGVLIPAAFLCLIATVFQVGVVLGPWAVDGE